MTTTGARQRAVAAVPIAAAVTVAALVPLLVDESSAAQLVVVLLFMLALLGLNVAMGYAGLLNLATAPIFGLGAYVAAIIDTRHVDRVVTLVRGHRSLALIPDESVLRMLVSIVGGAVIGAAIGLLLLLPALRLGRSAYTMLSLYMAFALPTLLGLERFTSLLGGGQGLRNIRELVLSSDTGGDTLAQTQQISWIVLVVVLVTYLVLRRLLRSHWGRALIAVRDDETSAAAVGVSVVRTKVLALAVFALVAAFAGALFAHSNQGCNGTGCNITSGTFGSSTDLGLAIFFFSALVVGGQGTLSGPVLGAAAVGIFQERSEALNLNPNIRNLIFGALLLLTVVLARGGIAGLIGRMAPRLGRLTGPATSAPPALSPGGERPSLPAIPTHQGLVAQEVRVRFGGNVALDGVALEARAGRVHALVGANGSGKTTLLNVISGLVTPEAGTIVLQGETTAGMPSWRRSRLGLGRTFQTPRVAVHLSALENVLQGAFQRYRTGWVGLYLAPWRRAREDSRLRREARFLLGAVGLGGREGALAESLSHGERRLLEVARALVAEPRVLLLDEPAAGLAEDELVELAAVVMAARDSGCAVVLVEHNLAFVRRVADDATVLERGRMIAAGTPDEVLGQPAVIEAFVGAVA